ncbi:MAG: hypothetical protein JST76_03755 [Bacteroidetes bacterium]|nr:hypothetical protein [Bacteroidota bacterium]
MTKELRVSVWGGVALIVILLLAVSPGCRKLPNGGVPFYLRVDSPTIVDDGLVGTINWKMPDVYVTVNNTDLGGYQMPVNVPVLCDGEARMIVSGGIYENGVISQRAEYPFWRPDTFTISDPVGGAVYVHHPVYHYYADVKHSILSDFNSSTGFDTAMHLVSGIDADSLAGRVWQCGVISLGATDSVKGSLETLTAADLILTNGRQAYLEFNFKQSGTSQAVSFDVGLRGTTTTGVVTDNTVLTIFPANYWKKTYIDFSTFIGNNYGSNFQVYFVGYNSSGAPVDFYFDDVKLLYFQ